VPNQAAEHYYLLTDAIEEVDPSWPIIEDPSHHTYIRPEGSGLMVGLFEPEGAAWNVNSIPKSFAFGEIEPDWDRMAPYLERECLSFCTGMHFGESWLALPDPMRLLDGLKPSLCVIQSTRIVARPSSPWPRLLSLVHFMTLLHMQVP
jgi:hypothetical protein